MIIESKTFTISAADIQEASFYENRNIGVLGGVGYINSGNIGFGQLNGQRTSYHILGRMDVHALYMKNETKELILELEGIQDEPFFVNITIGGRSWKGNDYDSKDIVYTPLSGETPNRRSIFKWNNGDDIFTVGQDTSVTITYVPTIMGEANFSIGYQGSGDSRKAGYIKNVMGSSRGTQKFQFGSFSANNQPEIIGLFVEKPFSQQSYERLTLYIRHNTTTNFDTIQINSIFLTTEGASGSGSGGAHDPNNLGYKVYTWNNLDPNSFVDRSLTNGGYLYVNFWSTNKRVACMKENLTPLWNTNVKRTGTWTIYSNATPEKYIGYKRSEGHTLNNGLSSTSLSAKRFNITKDKSLEELSWSPMTRELTFSYFTHQETSDELHTVLDYLKIGSTLFHTKQASYTDTGSLSNKRLTYTWENIGSNPFEYYEQSQHTSIPPSERVTPVEAGHYDRSCYINAAIDNGSSLADKTFNVTLQQNEPLVVILEENSRGSSVISSNTDYSYTYSMPAGANVFMYGARGHGFMYDFQDITFSGNTTTLSGERITGSETTTESIRIYHRLNRTIKINVTLEKNYDPDYTPSGASEQTLKVPITRTNYCTGSGTSFETSNQLSSYPTDYFDRHFLSNMRGVNIRPFVQADETTSSTFRAKLFADQDYSSSLPSYQKVTTVGGTGIELYGSGVTGWKNGKRLPANFPTLGTGTLTSLFQTGYYDGATNRSIPVNLSFSKFVLYNTGASYGLAIKNPSGELRFDADTVMPKIHTVITGSNTGVGQWLQDYNGDYYFSPYEASIYTDSALSTVSGFIAEQVLPESRFKTRQLSNGSVYIKEATAGSASRNATYTPNFDKTDNYVVIIYTY